MEAVATMNNHVELPCEREFDEIAFNCCFHGVNFPELIASFDLYTRFAKEIAYRMGESPALTPPQPAPTHSAKSRCETA